MIDKSDKSFIINSAMFHKKSELHFDVMVTKIKDLNKL